MKDADVDRLTLLKELDEAGATGLDMSPGDPLARRAAAYIRSLSQEAVRNEALEEVAHAIGELPGGDESRDRALDDAMATARALKRESNAAVRIGQGWIPVRERLPEAYKVVWVYGLHALQTTSYFNSHQFKGWSEEAEHWAVDITAQVTHWMPLPTAPGATDE